MRQLIIALFILGLFLEVSGLIWSSNKEKPSDLFLKLSEPPARSIENPLQNGYFLLLGLASAPALDPVQVGYDIWLETDIKSVYRGFDFDKPGRSALRFPTTMDQLVPEWNAADPLGEFQRRHAPFRAALTRHSTLLKRYERWLTMRFEDWGYAHRGMPRIDEILGAHRLYLAEGFGQQTATGLERLATDVARWRFVLQEARTLAMKIVAQVMVEDDVELLSRIVNRTAVDHAVLTRGLQLFQPLTADEYSLRWPVQSEFMLGYKLSTQPEGEDVPYETDADARPEKSLARVARLHPEMFRAVEHPRPRRLLGLSSSSQRTWDTYATFYDATIKTAESVHSPLPTLQDIARHSRLTLLDRIANPLEFSPDWEPFSQRLVETDARLRLAALQILMRDAPAPEMIPTRLAEVGSLYFDPFTGLPMLWSATQRKLYSVGKDRLDDGGDPTFDISVPLTSALSPTAMTGAAPSRS
jgi:hypothetical protein